MNSDYDVRLATLGAMGGDVTKHYNSVYDIDLEILRLTEQGGGGANITIDNDSIVLDENNHIAVSSELINYIISLESRIYTLEHPTTIE